jgi:hypothetical protein
MLSSSRLLLRLVQMSLSVLKLQNCFVASGCGRRAWSVRRAMVDVLARHLGMWSEEKGFENCPSAANMTGVKRVNVYIPLGKRNVWPNRQEPGNEIFSRR